MIKKCIYVRNLFQLHHFAHLHTQRAKKNTQFIYTTEYGIGECICHLDELFNIQKLIMFLSGMSTVCLGFSIRAVYTNDRSIAEYPKLIDRYTIYIRARYANSNRALETLSYHIALPKKFPLEPPSLGKEIVCLCFYLNFCFIWEFAQMELNAFGQIYLKMRHGINYTKEQLETFFLLSFFIPPVLHSCICSVVLLLIYRYRRTHEQFVLEIEKFVPHAIGEAIIHNHDEKCHLVDKIEHH